MESSTINSGEVEAAYADWKAIRKALNSPFDDGTEDAGHPLWAKLKQAENCIMQSSEKGVRVAEIRLWLGIITDLLYVWENDAADRGDAEWLIEHSKGLEPVTLAALHAVKALRSADYSSPPAVAASTYRIVSRFHALGGRFTINPEGQLDAAIDMARILTLQISERDRTRRRRCARLALALIDRRRDQIVNLIRQHGSQSAGWLLWENVA